MHLVICIHMRRILMSSGFLSFDWGTGRYSNHSDDSTLNNGKKHRWIFLHNGRFRSVIYRVHFYFVMLYWFCNFFCFFQMSFGWRHYCAWWFFTDIASIPLISWWSDPNSITAARPSGFITGWITPLPPTLPPTLIISTNDVLVSLVSMTSLPLRRWSFVSLGVHEWQHGMPWNCSNFLFISSFFSFFLMSLVEQKNI